MEGGSQVPLQYRYLIQSDITVNAFKPKDLGTDDDKLALRASVFGAVFTGRYQQVPQADHCGIVWQAMFENNMTH